MPRIVTETIGWIGMVLVLTSFALLTFEKTDPHGLLYFTLAGIGALGIALSTAVQKAYPAMVLNIIFFLIAVVGVVKAI